VVASCTSGEDTVLGADSARAAVASRADRPLLLIDLAVPRDIDPDVADILGVTLLNMDDISSFVASKVDGRRAEVPAVERIIAEEVDRYSTALAARAVAPLVSTLYDRAEEIRAAEMARLEVRTRELGPAERELLETMTRRIVAKLLHEPTVNLKSAAGTARGEALADAFRELFGLEP
jgi:glutamyl-tRNA reductase